MNPLDFKITESLESNAERERSRDAAVSFSGSVLKKSLEKPTLINFFKMMDDPLSVEPEKIKDKIWLILWSKVAEEDQIGELFFKVFQWSLAWNQFNNYDALLGHFVELSPVMNFSEQTLQIKYKEALLQSFKRGIVLTEEQLVSSLEFISFSAEKIYNSNYYAMLVRTTLEIARDEPHLINDKIFLGISSLFFKNQICDFHDLQIFFTLFVEISKKYPDLKEQFYLRHGNDLLNYFQTSETFVEDPFVQTLEDFKKRIDLIDVKYINDPDLLLVFFLAESKELKLNDNERAQFIEDYLNLFANTPKLGPLGFMVIAIRQYNVKNVPDLSETIFKLLMQGPFKASQFVEMIPVLARFICLDEEDEDETSKERVNNYLRFAAELVCLCQQEIKGEKINVIALNSHLVQCALYDIKNHLSQVADSLALRMSLIKELFDDCFVDPTMIQDLFEEVITADFPLKFKLDRFVDALEAFDFDEQVYLSGMRNLIEMHKNDSVITLIEKRLFVETLLSDVFIKNNDFKIENAKGVQAIVIKRSINLPVQSLLFKNPIYLEKAIYALDRDFISLIKFYKLGKDVLTKNYYYWALSCAHLYNQSSFINVAKNHHFKGGTKSFLKFSATKTKVALFKIIYTLTPALSIEDEDNIRSLIGLKNLTD